MKCILWLDKFRPPFSIISLYALFISYCL